MEMKFMKYRESDLPARSRLVAWAEFTELCDCAEDFLRELLDMGWISPAQSANQADLFSQTDVYRIRKLRRICADFEVPTLGGTIIVDLLARVDELERRVQELESAAR